MPPKNKAKSGRSRALPAAAAPNRRVSEPDLATKLDAAQPPAQPSLPSSRSMPDGFAGDFPAPASPLSAYTKAFRPASSSVPKLVGCSPAEQPATPALPTQHPGWAEQSLFSRPPEHVLGVSSPRPSRTKLAPQQAVVGSPGAGLWQWAVPAVSPQVPTAATEHWQQQQQQQQQQKYAAALAMQRQQAYTVFVQQQQHYAAAHRHHNVVGYQNVVAAAC